MLQRIVLQKLVGVNGLPVTTYGTAEVELKVDSKMFNHQTVITDVTTTDVILGFNLLEQHAGVCGQHSKEDSPVWGTRTCGDTDQLVMSKSVVAQVELMLDKSLQLPACSEMEVMIKAPGGVAGKTWILKTTNSRRFAVAVACAIVHPNEGKVPVHLLNPRDEAVTVPNGVAIAVMQELEEPIFGANVAIDCNEDNITDRVT